MKWDDARSPRFGRRTLLKAGAGAVVASAMVPTITFARQTSPAPEIPAPTGKVEANGFYPSGVEGVADAWTKFPAPFRSTDGPPAKGGKITALVMTYSSPPPAMGDNKFWQNINKELGATWSPILVPNANYGEKATAIIASGDLPDMFYLNYNQTTSPLAKFVQQGAFLDLTPYVTGDGVKEFPNLAKFPAFMWEATKLNGKIYGVPCPNAKAGQVPFWRVDWSKKLIGGDPANAQQAHDALVGMSKKDPDGNGKADTWGLTRYGTTWDMGLFNPMFRVPNNWKVGSDGKFTYQIETEEYKDAVAWMAQLWKDGGYDPDAPSMQYEQALSLFSSGRTGLHVDGSPVYGKLGLQTKIRQYQPGAVVEYMIPFGHDGGKGVSYNLPGVFGFAAIPASLGKKEDRVRELLRVFNWMSGPYGSEEYLAKNCGVKDVHYTVDANGFPITNSEFDKEQGGLTGYIGGNLLVNAVPDEPMLGPFMTDLQKDTIAIGIDDPTSSPTPLFSSTAISKSAQLSSIVSDGITDIITGRKDMKSFDDMVKDWKSRGGNTVRQEYEEAYSKNKK